MGISFAERLPMQCIQTSNYYDSLEAAIMVGHKCQAVHRATVFVHERTEYGLTLWKGNMEVFDIKEHPAAKTCYAWNYNDGERSRIFTVLGNEIIDSAQTAVQAMICADQHPIKLIPPLTNGLELLKQQMERAKKIIHQTEIRSEELIAAMETTMQEQRRNGQRVAR